jgi:hypothetical protein
LSEALVFSLIFIVFEMFEVYWQKGDTLFEVLQKIYIVYNKSIFFVLFLHPTIYLSIYLMFISGYDIYIQILLSIKLSDIALKLLFVKKVFIDKNLSDEYRFMLSMKIEKWMLYFGVILYPVFILLAF